MTEVIIPFSMDGSRANVVLPSGRLSGIRGACELELHAVDGAGTLNNIYLYEGAVTLAESNPDINSAPFPNYIAVANVNHVCRRRFAKLPSMMTLASQGVRYGYVLVRQLGEPAESRYEPSLRQASTPMAVHHR